MWIGSKVIQNTYKMMAFMVYIQYDGFYCIQAAKFFDLTILGQ